MSHGPSTPLDAAHLTSLGDIATIPRYDRIALPGNILHIGVGSFHRSHQAEYLDDLLQQGPADWSILGTGVLPSDVRMAEALIPQDCLYTLLTRDESQTSVRVIGSITGYAHTHPADERLVNLLASPTTRIVSLTVTEGGYPVDIGSGQATGEASPVFDAIALALSRRRLDGLEPFTVLSCDNVMDNGNVTRTSTLASADRLEPGFDSWIAEHVAFPSSMVDRITPATTEADRLALERDYGIRDRWPVVAEPFRQWVIEDTFTMGRPSWEDAGALMTEDVTPYEVLKLRLLNATHSAIAYLSRLSGFTFVHDVAADPSFAGYMDRFLDNEAIPALPSVPGIDVADYKTTLLRRFANPAIADQVDRLCLDGSAKFPIFLMPTVERQLAAGRSVDMAMLALAGWCSYLVGVDDNGVPIQLADDPDLAEARRYAHASIDEPKAFLEYRNVFPESVARNAQARTSFVNALNELRSRGAADTVRRIVAAGTATE